MNKKLRRIMQPSMILFFVTMLLFAGAAALLEQYILAGAALAATILLFVFYRWSSNRRRHDLTEYMNTTNEMMNRATDGEVPFPIALIQLQDSELIWCNKPFAMLTGVRASLKQQYLDRIFPEFSFDWLKSGRSESTNELHFQNRRFHVTGTLLPDDDNDAMTGLGMIYLQDLTELLQVRDEYVRSRPVVCFVVVDNYDELTASYTDAQVSSLNAQINTKIGEWADRYGGLLRKLERNRFLVIFEAKDLVNIEADKFSLLESVRTVLNSGGLPASVSIGIGKDGVDMREDSNFATLSIEMALSRGGDQAVIKDRFDFSFYGGRNKHAERPTKVRSRMVANSLSELITQSSSIFIMGHKMADLDAIGAAAGVCCLCRKQGKQANIVFNPEANAAQSLVELLKSMPEYTDCFITGEEALLRADAESLLIVVDTNRPDQVESRSLLDSIKRVVVIDHHRRAADYIERWVLSLHEPFASSASELVTEVLQYSVEPNDILPCEANALLAGLVLDTKNFSVRTSSRSFEAAGYLRRYGADTIEVKKLFKNDLPSTVARYKIIQNAKLYRGTIAIAALDYTATRTIAAQAADELLNISGIEASFVLYPQDDVTIISARSIGEANVQVILEPLGGGGNSSTAGAQIKGKNVTLVLDELIKSIDKFFKK